MNIYQRLNEVKKAINYLQKDKKVEGYKAITHDKVTSEVNPHFITHGIIVEPHQTTASLESANKATSKGTPITVYKAEYDIHFVNADEPTDRAIVSIGATAEDHGDKGPGKCASYATKTAMLKILSIETGESDESRQKQKPQYISTDQITEISDLVKAKGADIKNILNYANSAESLEQVEQKFYPTIIAKLKKQEDK